MTSDLGGLWTTLLDLLGQVVMPDWGRVVTDLLPLAVAGAVVAGLGLLGRAWLRAWRGDPLRGARRRYRAERRDRGATRSSNVAVRLLQPLALVPVGAVVAGLGLLDRAGHPSGNLALVVGGLLVALAGVALSVRASERLAEGESAADRGEEEGLLARLRALWAGLERLPRPLRRLPALVLAAALVGLGLLVVPAPGGDGLPPAANLPLLLVGLAIGLVAVATAVRDWERLDDRGERSPR